MTWEGGSYSVKRTLGTLALRNTYWENLHIVELDWECQSMGARDLCSGGPVRVDIITSIVCYWGCGWRYERGPQDMSTGIAQGVQDAIALGIVCKRAGHFEG